MAAAVVVCLVLGLLAVFVLLPRWQERRQERRASVVVATQTEPPTAVPTPPSPIPPEPHPTPPVTPTLNPVLTPSPVPTHPRPSAADRDYVEAMSEGLAALEGGRWQAAADAFARASRLRPDAPEVADGLTRARHGQRLDSITAGIGRAAELERREAWGDAEKTYAAVLALDPESAAALEGRRRSGARATLDERLEYHLANPGRLSATEVFADATSTLEEALDANPGGPRLASQIARLEALIELASTPVAVVLESDALTDVVVYRVGHQGRFTRRELSLKPGAYTVVGSRDGYRDVRLQLVVTPGSEPARLVVRCTEAL